MSTTSNAVVASLSFGIGYGIGAVITMFLPIMTLKSYAAAITCACGVYGIIGLYAYAREMSLAIDEEEERDKVKKSE